MLRIGDLVQAKRDGKPEHGTVVDIKWNMVKVAFSDEQQWIDSRHVIQCSSTTAKT